MIYLRAEGSSTVEILCPQRLMGLYFPRLFCCCSICIPSLIRLKRGHESGHGRGAQGAAHA